MQNFLKLTNVGVLLKSLSAFFLAFIAILHSSVNHDFLKFIWNLPRILVRIYYEY